MYVSSDLEAAGSPIAAALPELRARFKENKSDVRSFDGVPGVIRFKRHVRARYDGAAKRWVSIAEPRWEWESTVLVVATAEEIVDQIHNDTLVRWAEDLRMVTGKGQMMLMIRGLKAYNSRTKAINTREFTAAARGERVAASSARPSKERIEEELVKLQVAQRVFYINGACPARLR
jgi:crossover junction endonuclease EME1